MKLELKTTRSVLKIKRETRYTLHHLKRTFKTEQIKLESLDNWKKDKMKKKIRVPHYNNG